MPNGARSVAKKRAGWNKAVSKKPVAKAVAKKPVGSIQKAVDPIDSKRRGKQTESPC